MSRVYMNYISIIKNKLQSRPYLLRLLVYIYNFTLLYGKLAINILRCKYPVNTRSGIFIRKPKILQFPVTSKCNLNCKMCGLDNEKQTNELSPNQFNDMFKNRLFSEIHSVGINGGEPFLQKHLYDYIKAAVESFPKLKNIYLISNGTVVSRILTDLPMIKQLCSTHAIMLTFSISVDGIDEIHDQVRGREGTFVTVEKTCALIKENQNQYCDYFGILCTITKHNIYPINELDVWAKYKGYSISYNLATQHSRLNTDGLEDDFTVFADEHARLMTAEFFYGKFIETKSQFYYALYKFVSETERVCGCNFKYDGITILADGSVAYCATKSKILGNVLTDTVDNLFNSQISYREDLIKTKCRKCSHYTSTLLLKNTIEYNREILRMIGSPFKFR